ncbi:MAG: bifunctional [glutamine synthetase] adenylyltransferase/[glutamine synthetase]-adenylyl-L-tyrosine phosphorylase [Chakrabartia sp.]
MTSLPIQSLNAALERAERHSPHLRMLMTRFPLVTDMLAAGDLTGALADHLGALDPSEPVARGLRHAKGRLALAVAIGDLAGLLSLEDVVQHLSNFADFALDRAINAALLSHMPDAEPRGFTAIALGKHGSHELNYSSDIDPILLFDPLTLPHRAREEPVEAAVRIARKVVEIMQARDGDGYVFRVDLRLRPTPEATPIAMPINAAITYYESSAVAWERAAFIRARACAGDVALGQSFLDAITPFVWRRGLDFGAIGDIRAMSHRIREHHASGQNFGPGFDLKRGRGGIREVEFFTQIHQMIHGGREAALRVAPTLDALSALARAGRIDAEHAQILGHAYRLYRTVEHRLQMVDDQQTHMLPKAADDLDNVAKLHGLDCGAELLALLSPHIDRVGQIYDDLDGTPATGVPADADLLIESLSSAGFLDSDHAAKRIAHWRSGTIRALRTPAALGALEAILPRLIIALGVAPDPQTAINQLSTLIERLPSAINFFRLLEARPALLRLLIDILSYAPTLADQLALRPDLLDRLIDASAFDPADSVDEIAAELRSTGDLERQLDHVRRVVGDHRFALGVQVVEGASDPLDVASGYARVAEAALHVVTDATIAEFVKTHGRVPGGELVILALGRMGGGALTHASDLDLIYLFTGDFSVESDGMKPLGAVLYFNRLAQRVTAGLSVPTAAGPLYEIDTRLRPSGAKGPLSVSLEGFRRYQDEEAWTWEHMALTRARLVYGSGDARAETQAIVDAVLRKPRDAQQLIKDAVQMRADMAKHKPPTGPLDVKLCNGGLVDLEFAVHVLQLHHATGFDPHLDDAIAALATLNLLPDDMADAYRLLTRMLVTVRLMAPDGQEPTGETKAVIARACGATDWNRLLADLKVARHSVSTVWDKIGM